MKTWAACMAESAEASAERDRRQWLQRVFAGVGTALTLGSRPAHGAWTDDFEPVKPRAAAKPLAPLHWPELALLDGQRWLPESWQGQGAVVVVFATWCAFCQRHNAHVQALHRARPGLRLLGLAQDRDASTVKAYMARHRYTFPVALDGQQVLRAKLTSRRTLPMTMLLDGQGQVRLAIPGEMFEADVLALNPPA